MSDRERILYYLGGLVAAFVLAYLAGTVAAPALDLDRPAPRHEMTHE